MIGPYFIHLLTFIVFKSFRDNYAIQRSFLVYIIFLGLFTLGYKVLARLRMAYLSFAQIFSILSYSQIYFIPFGIITRFISSGWGIFLILLPALIIQPYFFNFLIPDYAHINFADQLYLVTQKLFMELLISYMDCF